MTLKTLPRSDVGGLSTIVAGAGRPLVLLHGVGLRAEAWGAQISTFRRTHQVLAPDMPGHGGTPFRDDCRTLEDYVQATLPLFDTLSEPALVVGHSMGAMIALELASAVPKHVRAVAALNGIFARSNAAKAAVQARAAALDGVTLPDPDPTLTRWFGHDASPARSACDGWLRAGDPKGYQRAYRAFAHADGPSQDTLRAMTCPALFVTGGRDPNSTPDMSRAMADLAPTGRAMILNDAAHMLPMTHADAANAALADFAAEVWP